MTLQRLSSATALPETVTGPTFDRAKLRPGIVHFGLGAFHRAHQAVYTQKALEAEFGPWGIVAVNLRSPEPVKAIAEQDGLYSITVRDTEGDRSEVIGSTVDWICAADQRDQVLAYLASPDIRIVTLTVSEKAYGLHPTTGGLDPDHPSVAADLQNPQAPVGPIGFIVEGLALRRNLDVAPFTVLCCDNLPSNGKILRRLVLDMANRRDPALAEWIAENGAFPSSMVDRIVPAATEETRQRASRLLGVEDALALDTEPFLQWVIEDEFVSGRPQWEAAGALFAVDVEPYEKMKLRLLNGSHTLLAHLGLLDGLECTRDVMTVERHVADVERHLNTVVKTLDPVPGIDLSAYIQQLLQRFANPTIAHRCAQIAMDTSQKIPQRIFGPAVEVLGQGEDGAAYAHVVGVWLAAVCRLQDCNDPRHDELLSAAARSSDEQPSAPFFEIPGLFPQALIDSQAWRALVDAEMKQWR